MPPARPKARAAAGTRHALRARPGALRRPTRSFELKKVGDGVRRRRALRYKVNSNAAVILTNDGVDRRRLALQAVGAAQALYREIQGLTKKPVKKVINTHFHWDHWQGNQIYAAGQSEPGDHRLRAHARRI